MIGARHPFKTIAFDFDGVIVESVSIKTEAMASLFADHQEHLTDIVAVHKNHAGYSRYVKFDMIYRDILKAPLAPDLRKDLGRRFSELVLEKVLACPFVPGALAFLKAHHASTPLFVVSGTPDDELLRITAERGLAPYFAGVYGSGRGKEEILKSILTERDCRPEELVFIGDGLTDHDAAKTVAAPFIGRVPETQGSPFPVSTPTIPDLIGLERALKSLAA